MKFILSFLVLTGCAASPRPPSLPSFQTQMVKPFNAIPHYKSMRPVEPRDWLLQNRGVTPQ